MEHKRTTFIKKQAFTLMELIFVIAILSIVAAMAIPKFLDSRADALVATIKRDISSISSAVQSHHLISGSVSTITEAIKIDPSRWNIDSNKKRISFMDKDKVCVSIELTNNKVEVNINETNGELCQKLYDTGIRDASEELF